MYDDYGYNYAQMDIEVPIQPGEINNKKNKSEKADIVIYHTKNPNKRTQHEDILGIIEIKRPTPKEGVK